MNHGIAKGVLFWLVSAGLLLTIIFSTSLHLFWTRESTLFPHYFIDQSDPFPRHGAYEDMGMLRGMEFNVLGATAYKLSSFVGDCGMYLHQAVNFNWAYPPYKYRVVVPWLAKTIHGFAGVSTPAAFILVNIFATLLTGLGFMAYLDYELGFNKSMALLGGLLCITCVSITRTLPFPMLEPMTFLASLLIFWSARRKPPWLFAAAAIFAVATKEVFIFATPLYWVLNIDWSEKFSPKNLRNLMVGAIPLLAFVSIRLALGGHPFEVEFGHNPLEGSIPHQYAKLFSLDGNLHYWGGLLVAFGAMWIGLIKSKRDPFTFKSALVAIPLVMLATLFFSGRISRVVGILYPIIIPSFLWLLTALTKLEHGGGPV